MVTTPQRGLLLEKILAQGSYGAPFFKYKLFLRCTINRNKAVFLHRLGMITVEVCRLISPSYPALFSE
jgi:hypothetical protein